MTQILSNCEGEVKTIAYEELVVTYPNVDKRKDALDVGGTSCHEDACSPIDRDYCNTKSTKYVFGRM